MLKYKQGFFRRTTSNVYRGGRRHVTKYVARAIYAGRQYSQYRRRDSQPGMTYDSPSGQTPLHQKLTDAWRNTPTKWYPLPVLVGALLLVALNFRKKQRQSSSEEQAEEAMHVDRDENDVVRLRGPLQLWGTCGLSWIKASVFFTSPLSDLSAVLTASSYVRTIVLKCNIQDVISVYVIGALPLRNLSRLWGYLNSLELPVWMRPTGFRLYASLFGVNLDEIEHDLPQYKSLGDFFYRRLKEGVRPIENAVLVSPADGKILHFGTVEGSRVEQVKGITYSLDALLGKSTPTTPTSQQINFANRDHEVVMDQEFADINGIEYTLEQLLGSSEAPKIAESEAENESDPDKPDGDINTLRQVGESTDASMPPSGSESNLAHDASVALAVGSTPLSRSSSSHLQKPHNRLHFAVIYLAPGDYHRFHSPAAWVVERRRHFVGELFSVSPYVAKRLRNLFVLNERVALLGRWAHGFFSMTPVGATNVGSILLNFDADLRTNVRGRRPPPGTFMEAVYSNASKILRGKPLRPGEEMGGFCLGSTVVLVFEAPKDFTFDVHAGQKVKVGQKLGDVRPPHLSQTPQPSGS